MHDTPHATHWLSLSASAGVVALAAMHVALVEDATNALDRSDPETLHDFRVALRRLRTLLHVYRAPLSHTVSKRIRRTLRTVAHATNGSRDADVHIAWITAQQTQLSTVERRGAAWVCDRLETMKRDADHALANAMADGFEDALRRLRRTLSHEQSSHQNTHDIYHGHSTFADVTAVVVRSLAGELIDRLGAVTSPEHQRDAHQARIAGKHLRYVLSPLADEGTIPDATVLVQRLKTLQDVLGDLHDADIFTHTLADLLPAASATGLERIATVMRDVTIHDVSALRHALTQARRDDPVLGILALTERLRERQATAYRTAAHTWFGRHARGTFANVDDVAMALTR